LVVSVSAAPGALRAGGGTVEVTGTVANAATCQLRLLSTQPEQVVYSHNPSRACSGGSYSARLLIGGNPLPSQQTIAFSLSASNAFSASSGAFYVLIAGKAPPMTPTTSATAVTTVTAATRATTTTTTAPAGLSATTTTLLLPGTTAPPTVPALVSTTTTTTRPSPTTVTTRPSPTTVTTRPPTTTSTTTAGGTVVAPSQTDNNPIWSGYTYTGGPFKAVGGTFTVPGPGTSVPCSANIAEWVGIDGFGNNSLIQAGIGEDAVNPANGQCTPGTFYAWAWTELWPAASQPSSLSVHVGDKVTVSIAQASGTTWAVSISDLSDGQSYTTSVPYAGPGSSAEWIVEAPTSTQLCGTGAEPAAWAGICELAPYTPPVAFTNLNESGAASQLVEMVIAQGGEKISVPSQFSPSGFTVTYGPVGAYSGQLRRASARRAPLPSPLPSLFAPAY
jgi:hypothetical protein